MLNNITTNHIIRQWVLMEYDAIEIATYTL